MSAYYVQELCNALFIHDLSSQESGHTVLFSLQHVFPILGFQDYPFQSIHSTNIQQVHILYHTLLGAGLSKISPHFHMMHGTVNKTL